MNGVLSAELVYKLTVIGDEEVPLAGGSLAARNPFFWVAVAAMLLLAVGILVWIYCLRCRVYRQRILQLAGTGKTPYSGWNLNRLKETAAQVEWNLVDKEQCEY